MKRDVEGSSKTSYPYLITELNDETQPCTHFDMLIPLTTNSENNLPSVLRNNGFIGFSTLSLCFSYSINKNYPVKRKRNANAIKKIEAMYLVRNGLIVDDIQ